MYIAQHLARCGVCSRRKAIEHIKRGDVIVNGKVVDEFYKVEPGDFVKFQGKPLASQHFVYLILNKPKGFITSRADEQDRKTVFELLPKKMLSLVFPVGRLDYNTTGILLLTNDGDLSQVLTHPKNEIKKRYHVVLHKPLLLEDSKKIQRGLVLDDGPVQVDSISYFRNKRDQVTVEIHSGKNRIIRRIFEQLGYKVESLDRIEFAGLTKTDLGLGCWRFLSKQESQALKNL